MPAFDPSFYEASSWAPTRNPWMLAQLVSAMRPALGNQQSLMPQAQSFLGMGAPESLAGPASPAGDLGTGGSAEGGGTAGVGGVSFSPTPGTVSLGGLQSALGLGGRGLSTIGSLTGTPGLGVAGGLLGAAGMPLAFVSLMSALAGLNPTSFESLGRALENPEAPVSAVQARALADIASSMGTQAGPPGASATGIPGQPGVSVSGPAAPGGIGTDVGGPTGPGSGPGPGPGSGEGPDSGPAGPAGTGPGFAYGGPIPGSGKQPAMVHGGEFVMNAAATKRFRPLLEKLNSLFPPDDELAGMGKTIRRYA